MNIIISIIKTNPKLMDISYRIARFGLKVAALFIPAKEKTMMFASFSGRNYDDSPRALYEYIIKHPEFQGWTFYWGMIEPDKKSIPNAKQIKFGSILYWRTLLSCQVWIGNGGIDKGIDYTPKKRVVVNTWHGTPMKRIEGEENSNQVLKKYRNSKPIDTRTLRCCQSDYDKEIFARVFRASKNCFIMSGLPRNDSLLSYTQNKIREIREKLRIEGNKKIILYMPTYREFEINDNNNTYMEIPVDLKKWQNKLGDQYCLLVRAHYAVVESLNIINNGFVNDVSKYSPLNDLYAVSDILISDYSSAFFDYAILGRPMLCFAYDLERYERERGFYIDIHKELPCVVMRNEDQIIDSILSMNFEEESKKTRFFASKYLPCEGNACKVVTDKILEMLKNNV